MRTLPQTRQEGSVHWMGPSGARHGWRTVSISVSTRDAPVNWQHCRAERLEELGPLADVMHMCCATLIETHQFRCREMTM